MSLLLLLQGLAEALAGINVRRRLAVSVTPRITLTITVREREG